MSLLHVGNIYNKLDTLVNLCQLPTLNKFSLSLPAATQSTQLVIYPFAVPNAQKRS